MVPNENPYRKVKCFEENNGNVLLRLGSHLAPDTGRNVRAFRGTLKIRQFDSQDAFDRRLVGLCGSTRRGLAGRGKTLTLKIQNKSYVNLT